MNNKLYNHLYFIASVYDAMLFEHSRYLLWYSFEKNTLLAFISNNPLFRRIIIYYIIFTR
jgi:hypothetical protein